MAIHTAAGIQDGYYGKWVYEATQSAYVFRPLGKVVTVEKVVEDIETQETSLAISFQLVDGSTKRLSVDRRELGDNSIVTTLAGKGADVTKKSADIFIDSIRLQEEEIEAQQLGVKRTYTNLGWIRLPTYDDHGEINGTAWCYRGAKLIGHIKATYEGDYKVSPMGTFQAWKDMVLKEVMGRPALEFLLLASLSAVVNGLLAPATTCENPIFHVVVPSGTGKSTVGYLLASTAGEPFSGQRTTFHKDGTLRKAKSLYRSWGATENAVVLGMVGNRGAVVVLNELGKLKRTIDVERLIYDLSEGSDKERGNAELKTQIPDYYATSIISFGESSLLERCKTKAEGLVVRVMELSCPLTEDAEHSRRIKDACRSNNGHAAPRVAKYIIDHGALEYVLPIFQSYCQALSETMPNTPSKDRFVEKFAALLLTTAVISSEALGLSFNISGLIDFLTQYEKTQGQERNTSANSYEIVIDLCRRNAMCFYRDGCPYPNHEAWGRITELSNKPGSDRVALEEFAIRRSKLREILAANGFANIKNCLHEWDKMGVLSHDSDRMTRSRKIDPDSSAKEDVYVLLVFDSEDPDWVKACDSLPTEPLASSDKSPETVPHVQETLELPSLSPAKPTWHGFHPPRR